MSLQLWNTRDVRLSAAGLAAPAGQEIISAELTFGACGTCQAAALRLRNAPDGIGRRALWVLSLGLQNIFRGIVDTSVNPGSALGQVTLIGPHRQILDGLGEALNGPVYGIPVTTTQAAPHQTLASLLDGILRPYPNADVGMTPDGQMVMGLAEYASPAEYTLDGRAYEVTPLGETYPDYVTDAVFDPGEGWPRYVYKRAAPNYVLRRTATATADPAIITKTDVSTVLTRQTDPIPAIVTDGVTHSYNNVIEADGVERNYSEVPSTATEILSDVGIYSFTIPADTPERRNKKIGIRCPFMVGGIGPWPPLAPVTFTPITGGVHLVPVESGGTFIVGVGSGTSVGAPPAPLGGTPTLDQVSAKVNEQNTYLVSLRDSNNSLVTTLGEARADLTRLADRVNTLDSTTTDANGNLTNLAADLDTVRKKLNDLGSSLQNLGQTLYNPRNTPKTNPLQLTVSLLAADGKPLAVQSRVFKEQDIGLELAFTFEFDAVPGGFAGALRYELVEQDTGRNITITFRSIEIVVDYETPNVEGVKMPDGWTAPYATEPRYQFRLPGVHVPPLRVRGLPGGRTQMAAGTTVTWHQGEASTLVTTASWPYPGQRRSG